MKEVSYEQMLLLENVWRRVNHFTCTLCLPRQTADVVMYFCISLVVSKLIMLGDDIYLDKSTPTLTFKYLIVRTDKSNIT